ncbi:MAG: division/cell wall cluster transcriptional repressor MraZ [Candidatus Magasanikbacteria bacterium]|nr:division/cell wall cluster transcriptional repressor MraZ [Candidatus Magasanikbacteria bacterium]
MKSGEEWRISRLDYKLQIFYKFTNLVMFIGEYSHNLDAKGRLAIPAKFRNMLKKGAVVTRGIDNCLFLYSKIEWEKIAKKLSQLPISQAKARAFSRLMLAGAMDVDFDNQGRIMLPEYLRSFAGLNKKTIVAGLYDRLEIWDESAWSKYKAGTEKESTQIAEALGELGV